MALKFKITKTAWGKLSEDMQKEYIEDADGKGYTLDVSGLPEPEDTGELKRAKDREKERADNLAEELEEANGKITKLEAAQGSTDKDIARVTARYDRKIETMTREHNETVDAYKGRIASAMKTAAASGLAAKISTAPKLMEKHILDRLTVEFDNDGEPTLKVLDKDGKASDTTVDKLGEELVANKDFSAIILGSKAKGGGAAHSTVPPVGGAQDGKPLDLSKASTSELTDRIRERVQARQQA
jgi:hypothetical protein